MTWKQDLLVITFQHAWRYHYHAAWLYQILACRPGNKNESRLLRALSRDALEHARLDLLGLRVLYAPVPDKKDLKNSTIWDMLILSSNIRLALTWLGWLDWLFTHLPAVFSDRKGR